jgi:hypothetical protein
MYLSKPVLESADEPERAFRNYFAPLNFRELTRFRELAFENSLLRTHFQELAFENSLSRTRFQ